VAGNITFVVDGSGAGSVTPVVFIDGGAAGLNLNAANAPTEAFGIGGAIAYSPPEGASAAFSGAITSVDKAGDVFVVGGASYFYDANDSFKVGGGGTTFANFEAQLSSTDGILVGSSYADSVAAVSVFDLDDLNPGIPTLTSLTAGTNQVTVEWDDLVVGDRDSFNIYRALSVNGTTCGASEVYSVIASSTDLTDPQTYVDGTVGSPEQYCYRVSAVNDGDEGTRTPSDAFAFIGLTVADASAPTIVNAKLATDAGLVGVLDSGDVHKFAFSEAMNTTTDDAGSLYRVSDADGTIYDFVCGTNAVCALNAADEVVDTVTYTANKVLTVTTAAPTLIAAGTTAGFAYPATVTNVSTHWDDAAGNQLNLAGSADKTIG
jgi:hypothetical protein